MSSNRPIVLFTAALALGLGTLACDTARTSPPEKASPEPRASAAADKAEDKAEDAARTVENAAEKAGDKIGEAVDKAGPALERAAEKAGPALDAAGRKLDAAKQAVDIKAALMADSTIDASKIDVDVEEGKMVHLKGTVPTAQQKAAAERIARDKAAGYTVHNMLVVASR